MAKKLSASSQLAELTSVSAEAIRNRVPTEKERAALSRITARQAADDDDSQIDFSDIPALTDEQLAEGFRPNRAREYVGVRLDWDVLQWLKSYGPGHSTRINRILRMVMNRSAKTPKGSPGSTVVGARRTIKRAVSTEKVG